MKYMMNKAVAGVGLALMVFATTAAYSQENQKTSEGVEASDSKGGNYPPPAPLPKALKGRWYNPESHHGNLIEVEVLEVLGPREARISVVWWPYCKKAESTIFFENKRQAWRFSPVNCSNDHGEMKITARVKPLEGKKRMEGWYGREDGGRTVYLEWD